MVEDIFRAYLKELYKELNVIADRKMALGRGYYGEGIMARVLWRGYCEEGVMKRALWRRRCLTKLVDLRLKQIGLMRYLDN